MKFLRNVFLGLLLLYVLFWAGLAIYFSYVDRNKALFETQLSRYFDRPVTIGALKTSWQGLSPQISIEKFHVAGEGGLASPLAFDSLTTKLNPWSILRFWPQFTEFSVQQPLVEIASLSANQISIGGIKLSFDGSRGLVHPKTVVRWLLDQHQTQWSDGAINWRRQNGEHITYDDISFVFDRENQERSIVAGFSSDDGAVNFKAQSYGDLLSENHWGASLEILDGEGQAFVAQNDFSLLVNNGQGELKLKRLQVQTIQDFVALSGLTEKVSWSAQAKVLGYLHDMALEFSGPLFAVKDWKLVAQASEVGFDSKGNGPKVNNLNGQVSASKHGGEFLFSTQGSVFEWRDWFESPFNISSASGQFSWQAKQNGAYEISLRQGQFDDGVTTLSNLTVATSIKQNVRNINSIGDLFTVDSVANLDFEGQKIVKPESQSATPLEIDASADFVMGNVADFVRYLPKSKQVALFRKWWGRAFSKGALSDGRISYQGQVSSKALNEGHAFFNLNADFSNVAIDYGSPQSWPAIDRGRGKLKIVNELLTITSNEAYIGGDRIRDFDLQLPKLFNRNRKLSVQGKVTKSLSDVVEFIFTGPLIAKKNKPSVIPIRAEQGDVELDLSIKIPLGKIKTTQVKGSAKVNDGMVYLPGRVPIRVDNGIVEFTEKSVNAKQLRGSFLGGSVVGDIVTTKQAQPPVFKINATGSVNLSHLKPWVGEHVLSLMDGVTPWQGSLLVDGGRLTLDTTSALDGVTVHAPAPLNKASQERRNLSLSMGFGKLLALSLNYDDAMSVEMSAKQPNGSLFESALIRVGKNEQRISQSGVAALPDGVNIEIHHDEINLDQCLATIIGLAEYESKTVANKIPKNDVFVDAMRSISVKAKKPILLDRAFEKIDLLLTSADGASWVGNVDGQNIAGKMQLKPFDNEYVFDLSRLVLNNPLSSSKSLAPIDYSQSSGSYPSILLDIEDFRLGDKKFGELKLVGASEGNAWVLTQFEMNRNGVKTAANGRWLNTEKLGSMTSFDFETTVAQADAALDDFSLGGIIKKGNGSIVGNLNWIGAPHEFDYSRLNGDFDLRLLDGELINVEPGNGKLLGLLNFNEVARRLSLDFRDVFADGLIFDSMQYSGLFSDGKAIMRDAYVFTPAVFVRMEGQVDIANEMIDMELHMSPELGGNLALLSALANPAAGAVVFLTQRVFKEQIRDVNFTSYRALGSWDEFEVVPFGVNQESGDNREPVSKAAGE